MSGELAKVIIRGFEQPDENAQQSDPVAEFHAMFNPESFAVSTDIQFDDSQADSETGSEFKFKNIAPREFSFEFIIDSTGASGASRDVKEEINKFKDATGFKELSGFAGGERRTLYLSITWGSFHIRCILKSMEVTYNLFRPDGTPIRATISSVFKEYKTPLQQARENPESAANLTRVRNISDQDDLASIAKNLYGDGKKYIDVAKENGLNTIRGLVSGNRLEFPPVNKLGTQISDEGGNAVQEALNLAQGKGKGQVVQSASSLAAKAAQQAQDTIRDTQSRAQAGVRQVQNLAGGTLQDIGRGSQVLEQVATQSGQNLIRSGESAISEAYDELSNFLDF